MAETEFTKVEADSNCVNPTLNFRFSIYYESQISYSYVQSGRLYAGSGILLGQVTLCSVEQNAHSVLDFLQNEVVNELAGKPEQRKRENVKLAVELSQAAVARIESERHKVREKTVTFRLELDIVSFDAKMVTIPADKIPGLPYRPRLAINRQTTGHSIPILHSEWVNNFCPHLGVGRFILVELQQPNIEPVSEQWNHIYNVIRQRLLTMEVNLRKGEWSYVMVDARQVFEDIKVFGGKTADIPFHDDFKNAFKVANHSDAGIQQLEKGIRALFDFCSKYIHTKDHDGNPQPCPTATKEDAEFVYALLLSFVNLLGSKLRCLS